MESRIEDGGVFAAPIERSLEGRVLVLDREPEPKALLAIQTVFELGRRAGIGRTLREPAESLELGFVVRIDIGAGRGRPVYVTREWLLFAARQREEAIAADSRELIGAGHP